MRTSMKSRLRCEGLEGRECPAVQVLNVSGTLSVIGDLAANNIAVVDNGSDVSVSVDGNPVANSPFSNVTTVVIRGAAGDDTISYTTSSASAIGSVTIQGGQGNDNITLSADSLGRVQSAATTQFTILAGQGADTIDASFGSVAAGDTVSLLVSGGTGVDNETIGAVAQMEGTLTVVANGDNGNDTISVSGNFSHGSTGSASLTASGGQGADNLSFTVAGEIDGSLTLQQNGNQGSDTINLSATIAPDSTGTVTIGANGNMGVDSIEQDVTSAANGTVNIQALGGMGIDTISATTDLKTGSTGTIHGNLDGGLKKDTLTSLVTVDGVAATSAGLNTLLGAGNWSFGLDGNLGFDTGTYTDGVVTPINVEVKNPV
jgi:hypothetical protein